MVDANAELLDLANGEGCSNPGFALLFFIPKPLYYDISNNDCRQHKHGETFEHLLRHCSPLCCYFYCFPVVAETPHSNCYPWGTFPNILSVLSFFGHQALDRLFCCLVVPSTASN